MGCLKYAEWMEAGDHPPPVCYSVFDPRRLLFCPQVSPPVDHRLSSDQRSVCLRPASST